MNIEKSLLGRKWIEKKRDPAITEKIIERYNVPDILASIMTARGITLETVDAFLNPKLKSSLPNPFDFKDMEKGVDRIIEAIKHQEKIAIFGDYDVDGITSSSVLYSFLTDIGIENIELYIPDREDDGYGPNKKVFRGFKEKGVNLVITVDCGITAFDVLEDAKSIGLDVIVIDHHEAEAKLPPAAAVIDPKRLDEDTIHTYYAAVGVVFLFIVGLNKKLREAKFYQNVAEPNMMKYLDLVALGTVCDVVPLVHSNRAYVHTGLQIINQRNNIGLKKLADVSGIKTKVDSFHLGYILGPRINAGGRVGKAETGAKLLLAKDDVSAEVLAEKLNNFNITRKDIEHEILMEALDQLEPIIDDEKHLIFLAEKNWHTGVMGIIAGRLKEKYNLPVCIGTIDEDGWINGSGRSVEGVDLGRAIINAKEKGILKEGGGHSMAAGFTCHVDNKEDFARFIRENIKSQVGDKGIQKQVPVDAVIDTGAVNIRLAEQLEQLMPYGMCNEEPTFILMNARLSKAQNFGKGHIRCFFQGSNGKSINVVAFNMSDTSIGRTLNDHLGEVFHLLGKVRINNWQGKKSIQFFLEDAVLKSEA